MRILHYFLGFPPYRSGGLTRYAFDLAKAQLADGNDVMALWPGEIINYSAKPQIKERKRIEGIRNFELINPLPVPLDEGIIEFDAFTKSCDPEIYLNFLSDAKPEVIHIHTLMGMHKEFINAAKALGIRTVFTTHDYFGLCPKLTLYRYGYCCDDDNGCTNCIQCNLSALSLKKIQLMQSPIYRHLKDSYFVKALRSRHRKHFFAEENIPAMPDTDINELAEKYRSLRAFYVDMYESIDLIHFNSTVAEKIYSRYLTPACSRLLPVTHQGIKAHKREKSETGKKVILFLAPAKPFKGWNVLKSACDQLWQEGVNFELSVYTQVPKAESYMRIKEDGFTHDDFDEMMKRADMLVAPSIWYETFGFTVPEALSYGVPVIVSNHLGAKDIVGDNGIVVEAGNVDELKAAIKNIDKQVNIELQSWRQFLDINYEMYGAGI